LGATDSVVDKPVRKAASKPGAGKAARKAAASPPSAPDVKLRSPGVEVVEATILGNHIKAILDEVGLTQEEAARRIGVSYRHFNRIVLDHSDPSMLCALRMEAVLGKPLDELFELRIRTAQVRR
jgi:DNA-binding XRE family transcriptional regulator